LAVIVDRPRAVVMVDDRQPDGGGGGVRPQLAPNERNRWVDSSDSAVDSAITASQTGAHGSRIR
jgi:hypothetical protein